MSEQWKDKCPHGDEFYVRLDRESGTYDITKGKPITVYCDICHKPLMATVEIQLPPKCMTGGGHTVKDCPLKLPLDTHAGVATQ